MGKDTPDPGDGGVTMLRFVDPPTPPRPRLADVLAALQARPFAWAVVSSHPSNNAARNAKRRLLARLSKGARFEVLVPPRGRDVYARAV